jgi:hypothetical protein
MSCHEGAKQVDFGGRHLGLRWGASYRPWMKHWRIDLMVLPTAGDAVTCGGPRGWDVSSPEENGPESYR